MTGIRPYQAAVLALLAGSIAGGPADACCMGGGMPKPSVPTPSVRPSIPRPGGIDGAVNSATRGAIDGTNRGTNSPNDNGGGSTGGGSPGGGGDVVGDGSKAGGDAPDDPTKPPGELGPLIANNNAGQPGPDVPDAPDDPTLIAKGDGSNDPNAPQSDAGQGGKSREEIKKMRDDALAKAKNDPEYKAILEHQRDLLKAKGVTGTDLTVQAIDAANKVSDQHRQEDQAAAQAAKDAKKAQDDAAAAAAADLAYRNSPEFLDYKASKWSEGYDAKLKAWEQNNLTPVGGKLLTPDEVAALNAENEKTYRNNRTVQQIDDDATAGMSGNPNDRPNGTTGPPPPIPVVTNGQPRPEKPADYKPPGQRTKVVRAGYE